MVNTVRALHPEPDPIPKVLRVFYFDEALMATSGRLHGNGTARMQFRFPEYTRSRSDMGHVSSVQITAAILEGGFCALEDALLCELFPPAATSEWFYSNLTGWLALRINILFRRSVKTGEIAELDFKVLDIGLQRLRRRKLSATIEFEGFCSGETTWVIDPPSGLLF